MQWALEPVRASAETSAVHNLEGRSGAGILVVCTVTRRMLLGKRNQQCSFPEHWSPFGGMTEPGEDPRSAARREVFEEAHLALPDDVIFEEPLCVDFRPKSKFTFYTYLAVLDFEPEVRINQESAGYAWFSMRDLPNPIHPGFRKVLASERGQDLVETMTTYVPPGTSLETEVFEP